MPGAGDASSRPRSAAGLGAASGGGGLPSFDDSLRVMDAGSRVRFEALSKELAGLRAQRKKRMHVDDSRVKMQVGMAKQGTVRGRKRRKEERLVRLLMEQFQGLIEARLKTHREDTPHRPIEDTVNELEVMLRAMAAASFPDLSAGLIGPAVRKAVSEAQEAAGITDPKDAMGGLGRCRVQVRYY